MLQEDSFLANLTLKETLLFMAVVKMEQRVPFSEKQARVREIIHALGLDACCNTLIGGPGQRGLSGGEKKRANIACEMLAEPSLLLLDEPTSGLDSSYALSMVKRLKNLCTSKRISVVASIHQPSSELFRAFDSLLALSVGRTVYSGPIDELVGYLKLSGLPCPDYYNPADHLMNISVGEESSSKLRKLWGDRKSEVSHMPNGICNNALEAPINISPPSVPQFCHLSYYPSWWVTQFGALLWRTFKNSKTLIVSTHMTITMILISFIIGFAYFQMPHDEAHINDRFGYLFFTMVYLMFIASFNNLITYAAERNVVNKERASGLYHISAYYIAKSLAELPIQLFLPSLFFNVTYWLSGVHMLALDWPLYFALWANLMLIVTTGSSVGSFFGAYFVDTGIALLYMPVLILAWMLFGGFYSRQFPAWLNFLSILSPINYGFDAALQLVFTGNMVVACNQNNNSLFEACNQGLRNNVTGLDVLNSGAIVIDYPLWINILVLVLTSVLFRALAYLTIRFINRPNNRVTRVKQRINNITWKQYKRVKERAAECYSRRQTYELNV